MELIINQRFIAVHLKDDMVDALKAALYDHTTSVGSVSGPWNDNGVQHLIFKTTADADNVEWLANYQADRLNSFLGIQARVYRTFGEAQYSLTND